MEIRLSIRSEIDGSVRDVSCAIGDGLILGRGAEEGVLLEGPDLSREHLVLTTDGTNVYVTDLSVNGTWLNGTRLRKSVKTRVRVEDSIGVPGYVLSFRLGEQPEGTGEVAVAQLPQAVAEGSQVPLATPETSRPLAMLDPVFRFVGSFTFMEKFLILVGLSGLLLLYTYLGS